MLHSQQILILKANCLSCCSFLKVYFSFGYLKKCVYFSAILFFTIIGLGLIFVVLTLLRASRAPGFYLKSCLSSVLKIILKVILQILIVFPNNALILPLLLGIGLYICISTVGHMPFRYFFCISHIFLSPFFS